MPHILLLLFWSLQLHASTGERCRGLENVPTGNESVVPGTEFLKIQNWVSPEQVVDAWKADPNYQVFFRDAAGRWRVLTGGPTLNGGKVRFIEYPPNYRPGEATVMKMRQEPLDNLFAARAKTATKPGTLHVTAENGTVQIGECVGVNPDGSIQLDLGLNARGERILLSRTVAQLIPLTSELTVRDGNHIRVNNPQSLPDGIRMIPLSNSGQTPVVDRKRDPGLKQFLDSSLPKVRRGGSFSERVDLARREVLKRLRFAKDGSASSVNYYKNLDAAAAENRGVFLGDALIDGKGVCKDFALATAILLQDAGINARYVSGNIDQGRHAWVEVQKPDGTWTAFEPQELQPLQQVDAFYSTRQPNGLRYKKGDTLAEIYRY